MSSEKVAALLDTRILPGFGAIKVADALTAALKKMSRHPRAAGSKSLGEAVTEVAKKAPTNRVNKTVNAQNAFKARTATMDQIPAFHPGMKLSSAQVHAIRQILLGYAE